MGAPACAQNDSGTKPVAPRGPSAVGGSVTGLVICEDTQRPARFADVRLIRKLTPEQARLANLTSADDIPKDMNPEAGQATALAETFTGLDGHYRVENLQPGDYFVLAAMPGYLTPVNSPRPLDEVTRRVDQNKMLERLTLVHVAAGSEAVGNVTLQRAGAISGSVRYDDGSPGAGIRVAAHTATEKPEDGRSLVALSVPYGLYSPTWQMTDDEGHYRLSGLPPGKYRIRATIPVEKHRQETVLQDSVPEALEGRQELLFYAPHTQSLSEAEVIEVKAGESHSGVDLELDLGGLYTVQGFLTAPDQYGIAGAGVDLAQDDGKGVHRWVATDKDGSFRLDYVPAGTYTLTFDEIRDGGNGENEKVLQRYEKLRMTVIVAEGDTDLGNLRAMPVKNAEEPAAASSGLKR